MNFNNVAILKDFIEWSIRQSQHVFELKMDVALFWHLKVVKTSIYMYGCFLPFKDCRHTANFKMAKSNKMAKTTNIARLTAGESGLALGLEESIEGYWQKSITFFGTLYICYYSSEVWNYFSKWTKIMA